MLKTSKLQTTTELHSPDWAHKEGAHAEPVQYNRQTAPNLTKHSLKSSTQNVNVYYFVDKLCTFTRSRMQVQSEENVKVESLSIHLKEKVHIA